jgi:hypothetical protein
MTSVDLTKLRAVMFDVECREDVDGKRNTFGSAQHLGIAVACTLTSDGEFRDWIHDDSAFRLFQYLATFDVIVGWNTLGFDYPLLGGSLRGEYDLMAPKFIETVFRGKTIDLMLDVKEAVGARMKLENVSIATLGLKKEMDGAFAPERWRKGQCLEVITYCRGDVTKTKGIYDKAIKGEPLFCSDSAGNKKQFLCTPKIR